MVNHVTLQGRLTRDLELRKVKAGDIEASAASFTLAWSEKRGDREDKCFLRCKAWRQTADFMAKYLHAKGTEMTVEGRLLTEEWNDKDGNKRSEIVLNVERVHFCGKRQDQPQQTAEPAQTQPSAPTAPNGYIDVSDEDGLPF